MKKFAVSDLFRNFAPDYEVSLHLTMKYLVGIIILVVSLLLSCTDGERMRRELAGLQARNQADSLLTDDSLALALCDYFDSHGTANEQMLAHYLLGRTYDDMGEAPAALDAFHQAADCADTTAVDCDYYILSRVYAQMSHVFYRQNLMNDYLRCLNHSTAYALKANDTIMALREYALKMLAYDRLRQYDSTMIVCDAVYDRFCSIGQRQLGAQFVGGAIMSFLLKGHLEKAKKYIDIYEAESGYFDSCHQISKGREIYYFIKGTYYLHTHQYDSAEYLFRKELREGTDFNNQNSAASGLSELFEKRNLPDSAAKYARYSYAMNDSVYAQMSTSEVERLQAMYNYTNYQKRAQMEKEKGDEARQQVRFLLYIIIGVVIVSIFLFYRWRQKQRTEYLQYQHNLELLDQYKTDVENLEAEKNTVSDRLSSVIDDAQEEIAQLEVRISNYEKRTATKARGALVQQIRETGVYQRLRKIADQPTAIPSLQDWQELRQVFDRIVPNFYATLYSGDYLPNETEYHLCMLIWLQFSPSDISNLIAMSNAYVSVARKKLLKNIFKTDGSAKEFDIKIREIT